LPCVVTPRFVFSSEVVESTEQTVNEQTTPEIDVFTDVSNEGFHKFSPSDVLPYKADYNVMRRGSVRGTATKQLLLSASQSMIEISYSSDASYLIFSDRRTELSQFSFEEGHLLSNFYRFTREGTGKERNQLLHFDQLNKIVSNGNGEIRINANEFSAKLLDPLSYQLLMQIALKKGKPIPQYNVVNRNGNTRTYSFEILGEEEIELPIGRYTAIKLLRKSESKKRYTYVWMIPTLNYVLGKLQLIEEEKESFMLQLTSVEWLNRDSSITKR